MVSNMKHATVMATQPSSMQLSPATRYHRRQEFLLVSPEEGVAIKVNTGVNSDDPVFLGLGNWVDLHLIGLRLRELGQGDRVRSVGVGGR